MAMRSGFDSTEIEMVRFRAARRAADFCRVFWSLSATASILTAHLLSIMPQSGLTVPGQAGKCFINGYFAFDDGRDKKPSFFTQPHETGLYCGSTADGSIKKVWVTDPAPGELPVRGSVIYDLVVARVSVGAGVSTITDTMITDLRADPFYCGRVKSLVDGIGQNVAYADVAGTLAEGTLAQLIQRTGGTMTGPLTLHGDPTDGLHAAPKQYVDSRAPQLVELVRFTSSGTFNPADYPSAGNRYLIMILRLTAAAIKLIPSTDYFAQEAHACSL